MRTPIKILILLLLTFTIHNTYSQNKVNVITKSVAKEFEYSGETLIIQGEKSNMTIHTWKEKKIKIEMKLIAKNPIESKALKDIEIMQYSFQKEEKQIKVRNYFKSNKVNDITSNLSTEYMVYIPDKCNIQLINLYGEIRINNADITGSIKNSFGSLTLNNTMGCLEIQVDYADLHANNLSGKFTIQTKSSDILIQKISGNYILNTTYGSIEITSAEKLDNLTINAQRTRISVTVNKWEDFNYTLSTQNDKINIPSEYKKMLKEESGSVKLTRTSGTVNKSIKISTTFCPITIKTE